MEPVYSSVIGFARGLFAMQGLKFTILGEDNIPRTGGAVMTVNHTGYFDFAYAGLAAQKSGRLVRFMAKDGVFTHPVSGPLMRGMKHIPVDRTAGSASYAEAVQALRAGEIVGVFPEATISRSFELKEFKTGAARMAAEAAVPILPVVIWGSQRVWTKGHPKRLGRTSVPIIIGVAEPIPVAADADPEAVTDQYKAVMADLLQIARAAYEPLTGPDLKYLPASMGGTAPTLAEANRLDEADVAERRRRADERRGFSSDA
ncbi:1-acyl-sn-glycerol-3-phosphate acyltransferase [Terrabacter sp. MAHUQ-38]|jgi:1-acyl-sn-glycerol-3-phosphate acyltransferase|uniref:lysophospholipid acyltransferase family protein n=1 Tax=unclassified Terrabacter TaxID=2630222 RepID=UPI00165E9BEC|nr:lysophospholipid acyltransferase family protein [Terrabacter sp. MAHUQ-38]MBC9822986.1 1-acyl-sn-glycerol-3-phosphate acyltransferase [Terrabacter sp. MAHUQ-38]